jgi:hypothetical protein
VISTPVLWLSGIGAFCFGLVIGWVTYRALRRSVASASLSDIGTVIGAVGGAAVTALFPKETGAFGAYCVGLAVGFFGYLISALRLAARTGTLTATNEWLGEKGATSANDGDAQFGLPPVAG